MGKLQKWLLQNKNLWIFLGIILCFGFAIGIYFGVNSHSAFTNTIQNYVSNLSQSTTHFSILHFVVLSVILMSSFFFIGIPFAIAYLFYEGMSLGFCVTLFTMSFHFKGFLYMLLFVLLSKGLFLFLYGFFVSKVLKIGKALMIWIIYKKNQKDLLFQLALSSFLLILLLLCYDLFFDLIGIKIIMALSFLLH